MAMDYAAEIRRMQPRGPYSLVGWSLGELLAGRLRPSSNAVSASIVLQ